MEGSQKSFSEKMTPGKRAVRSVLDSPYCQRVVGKDSGIVEQCLLSLSSSKEKEQKHWDVPKNISKEERLKLKMKENAEFLAIRHDMAVGLNEILRGLEKDLIASLIVSDSLSLNYVLGKVITELAERRNIPMIQIPMLHVLFKKLFGVKCHALGVKRTAVVNKACKLHALHEAITKEDELRENKTSVSEVAKRRKRKKPQPYCRNFYPKKKNKISEPSNSDDKMDYEEQNSGVDNLDTKCAIEIDTGKKSKQVQLKDEVILFQEYKPLQLKEVIHMKNPPKSKRLKKMKNIS